MEYIAYVIHNNVPEDQLQSLFEEKGIAIDLNYSRGVVNVQTKYQVLLTAYPQDIHIVNEFMNTLDEHKLDQDIQPFMPVATLRRKGQQLKRFSEHFIQLVGYLTDLLTPSPLRSNVIRRALGNLEYSDVIIKYDYVIRGKKINTLNVEFEYINHLSALQDKYVVAVYERGNVVVWDYITSKVFTLNIVDQYNILSALLPGNKIILATSNPSALYILDFNTGTSVSQGLGTAADITDLKIRFTEEVTIFVATRDGIFILSSELEIIHTLKHDRVSKILIQGTQLISGGSDICSWDINTLLLLPIIKSGSSPIILMEPMNNNLIVGLESNHVCVFKNKILIKMINTTDSLVKILVQGTHFVVVYKHSVHLFDKDGNFKHRMDLATNQIEYAFSLPDNRVLISWEGYFTVYNLYTNEEQNFEDLTHTLVDVSPTGKFILGELGSIDVYE